MPFPTDDARLACCVCTEYGWDVAGGNGMLYWVHVHLKYVFVLARKQLLLFITPLNLFVSNYIFNQQIIPYLINDVLVLLVFFLRGAQLIPNIPTEAYIRITRVLQGQVMNPLRLLQMFMWVIAYELLLSPTPAAAMNLHYKPVCCLH